MQRQPALGERLQAQAGECARLGSPLYAGLLRRAAADIEAGGPVREVLRGREADPPGSALALRLMGAVHRLVLSGELPELAARYADSPPDPEACWPPFRLGRSAPARRSRPRRPRPRRDSAGGD